MPHRELWQQQVESYRAEPVWCRHAVRDLEVALGFLSESARHRRSSVDHSGAVLGALISYSRPFTERPAPAVNQDPRERLCFLSFAADLGADLRLHERLLQMRDETIALSTVVSVPHGRLNARRFSYPDPRLTCITLRLNLAHFSRIAMSMRVACNFFQAEMDARIL